MHRPVSFKSEDEVKDFLRTKTPLHAYYSTAYYSNPEVPMKDKEWRGADLVFDLDADHIPGGEEMTYRQQLELVKKKTLLLIEEFLMDDLGIREEDLSLNFSGHRGYHIHVRRKDILNMSRQARREIVDYITGVGLDTDVILPTEVMEVDSFQEFKKKAESPKLPPEEEGGWRRRTRRLTLQLLKRWSDMDEEKVLKEMQEKHGVGKKTAEGLYESLYGDGRWEVIKEEGILDILPEKRSVKVESLLEIIKGIVEEENIREIGSELVGTTDEPVTGDTKRLIRLLTSIHGGSFLEVKPIDRDEFEAFDPLEDAIPSCLSQDEYTLRFDSLPKEGSVLIKGEEFELEKEMVVPEYAAPFLVTKYGAKLL